MVAHTFNPSTWEAETGRSLWVRSQPGLQELIPGQAPKLLRNPVSKIPKKQTKNNKQTNKTPNKNPNKTKKAYHREQGSEHVGKSSSRGFSPSCPVPELQVFIIFALPPS